MFLRGYSFAGLVFTESWLECWKPAESLLGTWEMIVKRRQTTGVSIHWVCETITKKNYSLFRREKGWSARECRN